MYVGNMVVALSGINMTVPIDATILSSLANYNVNLSLLTTDAPLNISSQRRMLIAQTARIVR